MSLSPAAVGQPLPTIAVPVTARMALAFSAGIGETSEADLDDASPAFAASPMYCASLEWRLVTATRNGVLGVAPDEARRAVHVGQDSRFFESLRVGRTVNVAGMVEGVRGTRAGALATTRLNVTDAMTGALLSSTLSTALYRGVAVLGGDQPSEVKVDADRPLSVASEVVETRIQLDRGFAHRYTECAEIWNPIHTERATALLADLPDIIVHGTALWALAGRTLIEHYAPGRRHRLRRLSGRFSAMVTAGTDITIRHGLASRDAGRAVFTVFNSEGKEAVSEGIAEFCET